MALGRREYAGALDRGCSLAGGHGQEGLLVEMESADGMGVGGWEGQRVPLDMSRIR